MLRRRRRAEAVADAAARWAAARAWWAEACERAAGRRPEDVRALLAALHAVSAPDAPNGHGRAAALEAFARSPALLLVLDRHARLSEGPPGPAATPGASSHAEPGTRTRTGGEAGAPPAQAGGREHAATGPVGAAGPPETLGLLLASMDADGRLRQAAVAALAGLGGPLPAAALAVRAVDHVPQVRAAARPALLARTDPDEAPAVVGVLLALSGRRRAEGLLAAYRAALGGAARRRTVRVLAAHDDPRVRRFGVELALDLGEYVRGDLLRTALHDTDQVCRRMCAQRLLELDPEQAGRLLWARAAGVRELAVSALPADVPATRLVGPLADGARMVRAQARWKLYQRGEPPADVYRRQLRKAARARAAPGLLAGLAAGLGECGDAADVGMLARLLPDPRAAVRGAAARAVGRLAKPYELVPLLAPLANDPDPGVAREVFAALARVPCDVPPETLWIGRTRTEPAVRRLAERIGARGRAAAEAATGSPGTLRGR